MFQNTIRISLVSPQLLKKNGCDKFVAFAACFNLFNIAKEFLQCKYSYKDG
jgi:hypothetical protein